MERQRLESETSGTPPPSTPARPAWNRGSSASAAKHPSTTPAGPPPPSSSGHTSHSFTPSGQPPFRRSESYAGPGSHGLKSSTNHPFGSPSPASRGRTSPLFRGGRTSPAQRGRAKEDAIMEEDPRETEHDGHHDHDHDHDDLMDDGDGDEFGLGPRSRPASRPGSSRNPLLSPSRPRSRASTMGGSPVRSPAKSRLGKDHHHRLDIRGVAKSIVSSTRPAKLHESDELILETERILNQLGESDGTDEDLVNASEALQTIWDHDFNPVVDFIGPGEDASPLAKADYVASLLLQLHHPPPYNAQSQFNSKSSRRLSTLASSVLQAYAPNRKTPIPKVLIDWLDERHDPSTAEYQTMKAMGGDYSSFPGFWEVIFACVIRGKLNDVVDFLSNANFAVAYSASMDGYSEAGYEGAHLEATNLVASEAIKVLESCPAYMNDDWDIKGNDWMLFRRTVAQAIEDLKHFAEEDRADEDLGYSTRSEGFSYAAASRRAESRVPFEVYESFVIFYDLLLGKPEEIIETSFDWLEATICLTAWWDGEDEEEPITRDSLVKARKAHRGRQSDVTPTQAYIKRLGQSLARVLAEAEKSDFEDKGLSINSNNPVEIALACIFEDNIEGVVGIMRGWSMTLTNAVVEIGGTGHWLGELSSPSQNLMSGFDKSDLMVLSFGQTERKGIKKDDILQKYADLLFSRTNVGPAEGWELAIMVLGRMDRADKANHKISEILDRLPLSSTERVDKILGICNRLALNELANTTAERYANSLAETSYNYGSALLYYARAHNAKKIREVLDLLISLCLIHSTAYPAVSDLDERLQSLIAAPKQTLSHLARTDLEAAKLLQNYLSGYATLRKFYDLRDEAVVAKQAGMKPAHRPLQRKRLAAQALLALINSAADGIRGGLYDPDVDNVIQVDGLLTLLGEALPFVNPNNAIPVLKSADLDILLRAVEDVQTAPSLVYAQCEEHLSAALRAAHGGGGGGEMQQQPRSLRKSVRDLGASAFSLVGSSTEGSGVLVGGSEGGSGVLGKVDVERGWDWRKGLGRGQGGKDVCRVLRLGLARQVAFEWMGGEE
ncbi:hypothetical protein K490DRAFT_33755 [Saccharata proteae CBS 121410]|uniref:Nuclear pore complex protein Nup85 n=1 Tax=Saccharata proteae CBS 121410 TaxID=1314787 RepID=A0A9P4M1I1_9PEZI|nr:hypothetical protein K490DRAFT_33755 [Saccharata proteae CBS 121410]